MPPAKKSSTSKPKSPASKAPAKKGSTKKSSDKSTATASTPTPAPAPAPEPVVVATPEPVVTESSTVSVTVPEITLESRFESILTRLAEFKTFQQTLHNDVKVLRREVTRQMREANKRRKRRPATADDATRAPRAPSGFAKPTLISDELCTFLGKPSGTEMARTEVTKSITAYIKEHSLQNAENKRRIMPDSALKSLLNVDDTTELTYFNLQKYMKVHFPKSAAALATASA
jgi:chromatin remodeling complex protein RSC6